ncbi:citrate lyase holo-[acyl-carrier protein] synthase [Christensenellaceae bacterium OttesenSCG-928-L17]|nr:citrate lyase holo-[acyl-carrier protein] synthase [Christensenellaceae bacterium OttesenSCG-928-L17]
MEFRCFLGEPATLQEILQSREARAKQKQQLCARFCLPVVSIACNIPGAVKNCPAGEFLFAQAKRATDDMLALFGWAVSYIYEEASAAGPVAYRVVTAGAEELKAACCKIEEEHPLGRLFDLDVVDCSGRPLGRRELNYPARRCLVCKEAAADCASRAVHTLEEVQASIWERLQAYGANRMEDV